MYANLDVQLEVNRIIRSAENALRTDLESDRSKVENLLLQYSEEQLLVVANALKNQFSNRFGFRPFVEFSLESDSRIKFLVFKAGLFKLTCKSRVLYARTHYLRLAPALGRAALPRGVAS